MSSMLRSFLIAVGLALTSPGVVIFGGGVALLLPALLAAPRPPTDGPYFTQRWVAEGGGGPTVHSFDRGHLVWVRDPITGEHYVFWMHADADAERLYATQPIERVYAKVPTPRD
jgi:hypothetical protein